MQKQYKYALPLSGGLDSSISFLILHIDKGLTNDDLFTYFVDYGQPYVYKEWAATKWFANNFGAHVNRYTVNYIASQFNNVPTVENYKIPGRNLLLMFFGAMQAENVCISAPEGEMHPYMRDKNIPFMDKASDLFTYIDDDKTHNVINLLSGKTKSDWVAWMLQKLDRSFVKRILSMSVSCFDEYYHHCGSCKPCFRKWVAFANNNLHEELAIFSNPKPYESREARKLIDSYRQALDKADFMRYSITRIEETERALAKVNIKL